MHYPAAIKTERDHCRIGSLEICASGIALIDSDHCRIGSLEIDQYLGRLENYDHCRIGSLESRLHGTATQVV